MARFEQSQHTLRQGTSRAGQIRRKATWRSNSDSMAWRTQRYLGCNSRRYCGDILCCSVSDMRSLCSRNSRPAQRKQVYGYCSNLPFFYPIALETMGPINIAGQDFISELGHRISAITDDPRETSYLYQRISMSVQRFNAICFANSFSHDCDRDDLANRPRHT